LISGAHATLESMDANQSLIVGVAGPELEAEEARRLKKLQPGGFILFGRNIKSPQQLRRLCDELRNLSRTPPLLCIDQEGGRVARLREIGSEPPSAKELTDHGTLRQIGEHGRLTGELLSQFGFNLDLCPVLDISFENDAHNSLKNRCWGYTPDEVALKAGAFNRSLRATGVMSCGKHFPGYSRAHIDPHHDLPDISRNENDLTNWEWRPFRALLNELDTIMMGHAFYPEIDSSGLPSSLSPYFIQEVLRDRWGFKGAIMTDDLDMGAIINHHPLREATRLAIDAGNDFILLCHRSQLADEALAGVSLASRPKIDAALERIHTLKQNIQEVRPFALDVFVDLNTRAENLRADLIGLERARTKSAEDAHRSPVEEY
jgi:beta-N-acetylhexosaminidase